MRAILFYCLFFLLFGCTSLKVEDIKHSIYISYGGGMIGNDSLIFRDSTFLYSMRLWRGNGVWNLSPDGKFIELQGQKELRGFGLREEVNLRLQIKGKNKLREVGGSNDLFFRSSIKREDIQHSTYVVFYRGDAITFLDSTFLYSGHLNRGGGVWNLSPDTRFLELKGQKDTLKNRDEINLKFVIQGRVRLREIGGCNRTFQRLEND